MPDMTFDESLPTLVRILNNIAGKEFVEEGTTIRDVSGRLTFIAKRLANSDHERETLGLALSDALGAYARAGRSIMFADDPGAQAILLAPDRLPIKVEGIFCRLLDRRIVGAGWLDRPVTERSEPPRIAFATLKGGVGRSTALAVTAMDIARRGGNVLVIDLDLEAPGLGDLLLETDRIPEFGVLDFLVENGLGGVTDNDLRLFVGTSALTTGSGGRVDVVPALGQRSLVNPENILPKLARAMIEDITEEGLNVSVAHKCLQ